MADKKKYVDIAGLRIFKGLIENLINSGDAKALKSFKFENNTLKFYKSETPGETPDFFVTLPEQDLSGLLEKIKNGTQGNIVTVGENGIVVDSGIAVSDIAKKSEVEAVDKKVGDISKLNTTAKTDIVVAVNEVKAAVAAGGEAGAITIDTTDTSDGALKTYTVKQGGVTIGTIDIPKDLVVTSGSVVDNPEGQPEGKYIKLVIANQEDPILINVGNLVDIYKAKENAVQIQISVDQSTREISATIVAGSVGTTELGDSSVTTAKIADANVTLAKLATDAVAAFDAAGSASTAETNAKSYADGLDSAMDTRMTAVESKVGEGFEPITESEINSMFTTE